MSIFKEIVKDVRQSSIKEIVSIVFAALAAVICASLGDLRQWVISVLSPAQLYYISFFLLVLLMVTSCLFIRVFRGARATRSKEVKLISATYGRKTSKIDITKRVRILTESCNFDLLVTNENLGVTAQEDPAHGQTKTIYVVVEIEGVRNTYFAPEGERLRLP